MTEGGADKSLVGKSGWNSAKFCDYSDSGPFQLRNFHRNFIFPVVKFVPANLEYIPASSESSPTIDSSDFVHWNTFPPFIFLACQNYIYSFWLIWQHDCFAHQNNTYLFRVDVNLVA
jgi:hypothetical protein